MAVVDLDHGHVVALDDLLHHAAGRLEVLDVLVVFVVVLVLFALVVTIVGIWCGPLCDWPCVARVVVPGQLVVVDRGLFRLEARHLVVGPSVVPLVLLHLLCRAAVHRVVLLGLARRRRRRRGGVVGLA